MKDKNPGKKLKKKKAANDNVWPPKHASHVEKGKNDSGDTSYRLPLGTNGSDMS